MTRSNRWRISTLAAAVLLSVAAIAAPAPTITNRAVEFPLRQAQALAGEYNYAAAVQMAQRALSAPGITPDETKLVNALVAAWQRLANDPEAVDQRIADELRDGHRSIGIFKSCADIAMVLYKQGKTAECSGAAAPTTR